MYDYGRLVFLDNQKTGSTYVSKFLKSCCNLKAVAHQRPTKHLPVGRLYSPKTVYFTTVREPFSLYQSLYRYGLANKGITWRRLKILDRLDLYDNFQLWLEFILDPKNAQVFDKGYHRFVKSGLGIMSYRTMRITLAHPVRSLWPTQLLNIGPSRYPIHNYQLRLTQKRVQNYDGLVRRWETRCIANYIFRQETLNASLLDFATKTVPQFFDQIKTKEFLSHPKRVNETPIRLDLEFPPSLKRLIEERERFLLDKFYSDAN